MSVLSGSAKPAQDGSAIVASVVVVFITIVVLAAMAVGALFYFRLRKRSERDFNIQDVSDGHMQDGEVIEIGKVNLTFATR